jgi:hypothetical protein
VARVIARGQPVPEFDLHCPLLNVPYAARTHSVDAIPATVPHVVAPVELVQRWGGRIAEHAGSDKRIGIAWAGSGRHNEDRHRSLTLQKLAPLLDVPGLRFFSLQIDRNEAHDRIIDLTSNINDFADTAALIANLDLIITVDTAAAHLAGALAKPVWILLPYNPDWRWLLQRDDSPWYPTARLFRQPRRGDWDSVIERVAAELSRL